jgi:hypothetical protein
VHDRQLLNIGESHGVTRHPILDEECLVVERQSDPRRQIDGCHKDTDADYPEKMVATEGSVTACATVPPASATAQMLIMNGRVEIAHANLALLGEMDQVGLEDSVTLNYMTISVDIRVCDAPR